MALTVAQERARQNRDTIFIEDGEILAVNAFASEQFVMRIQAPKCAAAARPGSFVHVTCDASLPMRRPLSIMRAGDGWIEILFKIVGQGLHLLSQKQPDDCISVLGPIGRPFQMSQERPNTLLIGGGVGIPPMIFIADWLRRQPGDWQAFAILGSEIPFPFTLQESSLPVAGVPEEISATMPLLEKWGIPARLTSLQGYEGCFDGYVTVLADTWLNQLPERELARTEIFACGPTVMLRAVADLAARYDLPCQISLEEFMACAVGGCAGCAVKIDTPGGEVMRRVCVDGPVFDAASVVW